MHFVEDPAAVRSRHIGVMMVMVMFFVFLPGPSGLDKGAEAESRQGG